MNTITFLRLFCLALPVFASVEIHNPNRQSALAGPEISIVGNFSEIVSGSQTATPLNHTDFGSASIESASTVVTFTVKNTGTSTLTLGPLSISGDDASSFSIVQLPGSTVAANSSKSFKIAFNPTTLGQKVALLSLVNNDSDENPYTFKITGNGVRTYVDTDGDGISDNFDIDDDNDGILDIHEQAYCLANPLSKQIEYVFLNETFGTGTTKGQINVNIPGATCTYCYEDGIVGANTDQCPSQSTKILDDGEYVVTYKITGDTANDPENIHGDLAWYNGEDHTPNDVHGRMAVFNASHVPGVFYETTINGVIPNVPITYSFWALNIMAKHTFPNSILPNITVEFIAPDGSVLSTFNTGDIGRCSENPQDNTCTTAIWHQFTTSVNLGNHSTFAIRFKNNAPGGGGNDLALDDITIKQQYCDSDGDGVANIFDLDSDNDGIPDIEEAGLAYLSNGKALMNLTAGNWVDLNQNGYHDALEANNFTLPDTDLDGVPNFLDLDSDNDSIFDIDEAGLLNGDGDINGDGVGDGPDSDGDGVLDAFDNSPSFGTHTRPFAKNTDGLGNPDYLQCDSNNDGIFDISTTLYHQLDTNNDGRIDGTADIDKDGIIDTFDSSTTALGSPRDLNRKLNLDFDGRNDYALTAQNLSGFNGASIMGWVRYNTSATESAILGQSGLSLKITGTASKRFAAVANGVEIVGGPVLSPNRWYHIAAIFDGQSAEKIKLYVNGRLESVSTSTSIGSSIQSSAHPVTIGKKAGEMAEFFKGTIDEVRIFNTALTADQLQKMVYQEIQAHGQSVRGLIIPKNIENTDWSSLIGYYRMDVYKDDVIDNLATPSIDAGTESSFARIYNVKSISPQLAPMPFQTTDSGSLVSAVSQNNFINGRDVLDYDWTIIHIRHDINQADNLSTLGLIVDENVLMNVNNDNAIKNSWYLKLDGKADLIGQSQLVQSEFSDLDPTSKGSIERDQQGTTNRFNYNYWASPVGLINPDANNTNFTVAQVLRDGTDPNNPQELAWTASLNSVASNPLTLSNYWIFKFQNLTNAYANWIALGSTGEIEAGQGFTLKGSNASTGMQNYTFVGKPNSGDILNPIAKNNLNLSGNPYPSAIDADKFILDNLQSLNGTIYFWEHFSTNNTHTLIDYQGGYAMRTLVGGTPPVSPTGISGLGTSDRIPGRFIPVGQGFIVTGSTVGGDIKFTNAQRAFIKENNVQSNVLFRQNDFSTAIAPDQTHDNSEDSYPIDTYARIRLGFNSANNYHRQALIGFMDDRATSGIDKGYDAIHIDTQPSDMYFMKGTTKLVILGESYYDPAMIFPIGVKNSIAGNVSFVIDGLENFDPAQPIYIYDNQTQLYHNIREQMFETYLASGTFNDRFSLRFQGAALGTNDNAIADTIKIAYTQNDDTINIKNMTFDNTVESVLLYNMLGQLVQTWDVKSRDQQNISLAVSNLSNGTYIVSVTTTNGIISKKIAL